MLDTARHHLANIIPKVLEVSCNMAVSQQKNEGKDEYNPVHKGPCRTPVPQQSDSSSLSIVIILRIQERYGVDSAQVSGLGK